MSILAMFGIIVYNFVANSLKCLHNTLVYKGDFMIDIVWDMETNDPDDFLTLLFLAGHPSVNLKAVTIFPGSSLQVGLIRKALSWFSLDIPVGARNLDTQKQTISQWHYDAFGDIQPSRDALPADDVLRDYCDMNTTLLMGAPLTNLRTAIRTSEESDNPIQIGQLVIQGGFAGEGIVPPDLQLEKFKGRKTYPTHNLIVDKKATERILKYSNIGIRRFVSKNVCHRVIYDATMHKMLSKVKGDSLAIRLIWQGMDVYLKTNPQGKMLHDVLAACCAIDPTIATWQEVELYRNRNEWGARKASDTGTLIIVDYDHDKFLKQLTMLAE